MNYILHSDIHTCNWCSVQKLHLPPELSDTASRAQEDRLPGGHTSGTGGQSLGVAAVGVAQRDKRSKGIGGRERLSKHNIDF